MPGSMFILSWVGIIFVRAQCPIVVFPPSHFPPRKNDYIIEHSHFPPPQFSTGGKVAI